jgi:hypothetical protein
MAIKNLRSGVYVVKDFKFLGRGGSDSCIEDEETGDEIPVKALKASKKGTVYECHAYGDYENEGIYFSGEIVFKSGGLEVSEASSGMVFDDRTPAIPPGCKVVVAVDND